MKRRKIRNAKARPAKRSAASKPAFKRTTKRRRVKVAAKAGRPDPLDALIAAGAQTLGLALDPAWTAAVKFNFELILRHAALVDEFPLPDDTEPAPVFHA